MIGSFFRRLAMLPLKKSFHIGGIVLSLWPLLIAVGETMGCHPDWEVMCGTGMVIANPIGFYASYPLLAPIFAVLDSHPGSLSETAEYWVMATCVLIVHYLAGGLFGVWIGSRFGPKTSTKIV